MEEIALETGSEQVDKSSNASQELAKALDLYSVGEYGSALSAFQNIPQSSENSIICCYVGNCYKNLGQIAQAKQYWENSLKLPPINATPYVNLGSLYYEGSKISKAILYWTIALTITPENYNILYNLAAAYNKKKYRIQALLKFENYVKYNKNIGSDEFNSVKTTINKLRGMATTDNKFAANHMRLKSFDKAAKSYISSVLNYPLQANINQKVGSIFFEQEKYEKAIKYWLDAYIVSDFEAESYEKLPVAYEKLEMPSYAYCFYYLVLNSKAVTNPCYKAAQGKLIELTPVVYNDVDYSDIHFLSGKQYEEDNNYHHALMEYKNAFILAKSKKELIKSEINKMNNFIYPEICLSSSLVKKAQELFQEKKYTDAMSICDRVLLLSEYKSETAYKAKKIKNECQTLLQLSKK